MSDWITHDENATPLTPEEQNGLIPTYVTLRQELNEIEQNNISKADLWVFQRKRKVLDEGFLKRLHKRMFCDVWKWSGEYRETPRNLGVDRWKIQPEIRQLLDDVSYWIEHQTFAPDEIAIRFHHKLVWIHPFPNGNGRWGRLAADILIVALGGQRFTWGHNNLQKDNETRRRYISALQKADNHDISALVAFARS